MTWSYYNPGIGYIDEGGFAEGPAGFYAFLSKAASTTLLRQNADDSSWTRFNTSSGATFAMARSGNTLFATRIDGLWRYDLSTSSVSGEPHPGYTGTFSIAQNYPNPFNPTTTIRYTIPEVVAPSGASLSGVEGRVNNVRLVVYDVLGREAATLVDEVMEAGTYTVRFDASGLASGVYFHRLTAGNLVDAKKLILLK